MTSSTGTFTYWTLLGLPPGSDLDQLKRAFRSEARRWHPDLNKNDRNAEERLKWINEAYQVLSDPQRKFEWEIAGRPTFEIKECSAHPKTYAARPTQDSENVESKTSNISNGFSSSEKLLILLISVLSLFFFNTFL